MKDTLKTILKKHVSKIIAIILLVGLNVYLLTCPSKILGKIIDLLYNSNENKYIIFNNIIYLLFASIGILLVRVVWKYLVGFLLILGK